MDDPLQGKNIIFINSGGPKKAFTLEKAKRLGVNTILINNTCDAPKKWVDHFIAANTYDAQEIIDKIHAFLEQNPDVTPDGAITFWEDDIPILAKVCEEFDLTGNSYETAVRTRNKYEMRKRLEATGLGNPKFHLVKNQKDLRAAAAKIGFPAVMKPVWGSDSEFVMLVKDEPEAKNTLAYLVKNCTKEFNSIFTYNNGEFLFEEYMEGMEVSVECFAQYGIPHVIGINEKQSMKPPYFVECGDVAPARITQEQENEVIKLAESAMIALGVVDSLAHIEIKITPAGAKIVEVGSRMGGDDIYLYVKNVWGADMIKTGIEISLGQRTTYKKTPPKDHIVCRYFIPDNSGVITKLENEKTAKKLKNVVHMLLTKKVGDAIFVPPEGFETIGWAISRGKTYQEAETALNKIMAHITINVTKFHKDSVIGKTGTKYALDDVPRLRAEIMGASRVEKLKRSQQLEKLKMGVITDKRALGEEISRRLKKIGYSTKVLDDTPIPQLLKNIQEHKLEFAINLSEQTAGLFEILQIPHTGPSVKTIALATDKIMVKELLEYHGIPTPKWDYIESLDEEITEEMDFPLIVKPANTDDFFGINENSIVTNEKELQKQIKYIVKELKKPALIEEYIDGDEYVIYILGNGDEAEVLPIMQKKYNGDLIHPIRTEKKPKIPAKLKKLISEMALDTFGIFECRDYAKVELRVDRNGNPFIIELSPNPPLGRSDEISAAARTGGYSYNELLDEIVYAAIERYKDQAPLLHNIISFNELTREKSSITTSQNANDEKRYITQNQ